METIWPQEPEGKVGLWWPIQFITETTSCLRAEGKLAQLSYAEHTEASGLPSDRPVPKTLSLPPEHP